MSKKKTFNFSHTDLTVEDARLERIFSVVPGALSWLLLAGMIFLSFVKPIAGAMLVIAYHIFWLIRLFYMTLFLVLAYGVLAVEKETDWVRRCRHLSQGMKGLELIRRKLSSAKRFRSLKYWMDYKNQERELRNVLANHVEVPDDDTLYHLVIIAAAKESRDVLEPGLRALTKSRFPAARIIPVLAVEERFGHAHAQSLKSLGEEYRSFFYDLLVTVHPDGLPGEARVKGANATFAAKQAARFFEAKKIDFKNIVVSCFDADTVAAPDYFAALTYHYMRHPKRERASYQPIPVYDNNIWEVSGFARVLEMGSSFFQLIEATNPEKLVTFSSHSMSFKALVEIGYWPVDMISDDSAIFWKAFIHYGGDYRVVPMYMTLSMDAVMAGSLFETVKNIYLQKRRWAWGVENFPIVARAFVENKAIPLLQKLRYGLKLLEMHVSWATVGFFITFIGWLPAIFASREFSSTVLYYNSARITQLIFNLASAAFFVMIVLSYFLLPRIKVRNPLLKRALFALEWLVVPLVFTLLCTLPALDAQTRLMLGRPLKFHITEKRRGQEIRNT